MITYEVKVNLISGLHGRRVIGSAKREFSNAAELLQDLEEVMPTLVEAALADAKKKAGAR